MLDGRVQIKCQRIHLRSNAGRQILLRISRSRQNKSSDKDAGDVVRRDRERVEERRLSCLLILTPLSSPSVSPDLLVVVLIFVPSFEHLAVIIRYTIGNYLSLLCILIPRLAYTSFPSFFLSIFLRKYSK